MFRKRLVFLALAAACGLSGCMNSNSCDRPPSMMDRLRSRFGGNRGGDCCAEGCPCGDGCPSCGDGCSSCGDGPMLTAPPFNAGPPPIGGAPIPGPGPLVPQATMPGQFQQLVPVPQATPVPAPANGTARTFSR